MFQKIKNRVKQEYTTILTFLTFIFSLFFTKEINFLHYNTTSGPDFEKYFKYLEYNFFLIDKTGREQGVFYYYLNSWNFYRYNNEINDTNFFYYLDKSIQEVNFFLFIFSLLGFYLLLKLFGFKKNDILITLIAFSFFPLGIALRIVLKPEILALSFLPWIILCLEFYKKTKKYRYLYLSLPFLVISIYSKGSVLAVFGLFFLFFYSLPLLRGNIKKILLVFITFILLFSALAIEDYESNGSNILEVVHDEKYNNKAKTNFLYYVDVPRLIKSPIKFNHSNSFISLTLLDIFGDYFDLYWNEDSNLYSKHRKEVFLFEESSGIGIPSINLKEKNLTFYVQNKSDIYLRQFLSLIFGILFFIFLFGYIKKKNVYSKFVFAPLFGMAIMNIQSVLGFPQKNFDPLVGDSIKPYYYGYFLCMAFLFVTIQIFNKSNKSKILIFPYIFFMLFLLGFPKDSDSEYSKNISQVNSYSSLCIVNKPIIKITSGNSDYLQCSTRTEMFGLNYREYNDFENFKSQPRLRITNSLLGFLVFINTVTVIILSRKDKIYRHK